MFVFSRQVMLTKSWYIKSKALSDSIYNAIPGSYALIVWALFFFNGLSPVEPKTENLTKESQRESLNVLLPEETDILFQPLYSPKEPNPVSQNPEKSDNKDKAGGFDDTESKRFCFSASCHLPLDQSLSALPGQDSLRNRATVSLVILYQSWKICFDFIS